MLSKLNRWKKTVWMMVVAAGLAASGSAAAQGGTAVIALPGEAQTLDMQITTAEVAGSISWPPMSTPRLRRSCTPTSPMVSEIWLPSKMRD